MPQNVSWQPWKSKAAQIRPNLKTINYSIFDKVAKNKWKQRRLR